MSEKTKEKIGCPWAKCVHNFCWFWFGPRRICTGEAGKITIDPKNCPLERKGKK